MSHSSSNKAAHGTPKEHLTTSAIFLSLLLTLCLIGLGQRGLYDLNKKYNKHYDICNQVRYITTAGESCPFEQYAFQQVKLHSYLSLPLFIFFLSLVLFLKKRRLTTWQKALFRVSSTVAIFFGLEFLIEATVYLFQYYPTIGWYFCLSIAAILIAILIVYIEKKQAAKKAAGAHH